MLARLPPATTNQHKQQQQSDGGTVNLKKKKYLIDSLIFDHFNFLVRLLRFLLVRRSFFFLLFPFLLLLNGIKVIHVIIKTTCCTHKKIERKKKTGNKWKLKNKKRKSQESEIWNWKQRRKTNHEKPNGRNHSLAALATFLSRAPTGSPWPPYLLLIIRPFATMIIPTTPLINISRPTYSMAGSACSSNHNERRKSVKEEKN